MPSGSRIQVRVPRLTQPVGRSFRSPLRQGAPRKLDVLAHRFGLEAELVGEPPLDGARFVRDHVHSSERAGRRRGPRGGPRPSVGCRAMDLERLSAVLAPGRSWAGRAASTSPTSPSTSARARPAALFFCVPGSQADGHEFAPEAVEDGAVALVVERRARRAGAAAGRRRACAARWGRRGGRVLRRPEPRLPVAGITGTSGKTTTSYLLWEILDAAGLRPGLVGSIERRVGCERLPVSLNTPEAIDLQRLLRADGRRGQPGVRDRGDVDRVDAGPARGAALRGARLHEPRAGPPRLPRDDGRVLRGEAAAVPADGSTRR